MGASNDQSIDEMRTTGSGEEGEYLTGLELLDAMTAISLIGFLMLLDSFIVYTVSLTRAPHSPCPIL